MNLRLLARFALIALLAAVLAPAAAHAFDQARPRPLGTTPGRPFPGPRPPPPRGPHRNSVDPNQPRVMREIEHGGEEVAQEAEHESDTPGDINLADFGNDKQPPYLAALINFGLLAALYYTVGKKPVAAALKERQTRVQAEIEEAQKMKREAEERAKKYQEKLANLEDELASTKASLEQSGKADRERIVKEAQEKAERMQRDASFLLEQEVKQMRMDLQRETVDAAIAAAAELLKKRVTPEDQERMAEEFLKSLPAAQPRAT